MSVMRMSIAAAHGSECLEEISAYYLADEIRGMMRDFTIGVSDHQWKGQFGKLTLRQLANLLIHIAVLVNLTSFRKSKRGPKKPTPKRTKYKSKTHVSTARILAEARGTNKYLQ